MIRHLAAAAVALASTAALALPPSTVTPLAGTWNNVNTATPGVVKVVVTTVGSTVQVRAYGACTPTPCDWGTVTAEAHSTSVSSTSARSFRATYNFGYKTTVVTGMLKGDIDNGTFMDIDVFNKFASGDTRRDYSSREVFRK